MNDKTPSSGTQTLFYSPCGDDLASSLSVGFAKTLGTAGTTDSATTTAPRGLAMRSIGRILRQGVSAFRPFARVTPKVAGSEKGGRFAAAAVSKPKLPVQTRSTSAHNFLGVFESPHRDENAHGPRAGPSTADKREIEANAFVEVNLDDNARRVATRQIKTPLNNVTKGRVSKTRRAVNDSSKRRKRSVPLREGETRTCAKCGVRGGSKIHWRHSYDENSDFALGADLCDKCGKQQSRMLQARKKQGTSNMR